MTSQRVASKETKKEQSLMTDEVDEYEDSGGIRDVTVSNSFIISF